MNIILKYDKNLQMKQNYRQWLIRIIAVAGIMTIISGCMLKVFIPAPPRSFLPEDLLLTEDDLSSDWTIAFGPREVSDDSKPLSSMEIGLLKSKPLASDGQSKWDVMESVYRFNSIEGAKEDYAVTSSFPGSTDVTGWNFISTLADEQIFSCYTYSNMTYPVCHWNARYKEFEIEVIGWLDPDRVNLQELQSFVTIIDEKVVNNLDPDR